MRRWRLPLIIGVLFNLSPEPLEGKVPPQFPWDIPAIRIDAPACPTVRPVFGRIRGLLVGVNKYRARDFVTLDGGAVRDATLMRQALISSGAESADIVLLVDEAATRERLEEGLNELISSTQCGDVVFFSFSGISSRGRENDGFELYYYDCDPQLVRGVRGDAPPLPTSVLRSAVTAIRNRGAFAFVLLDGVHTADGFLDSGRDSVSSTWRYMPGGAKDIRFPSNAHIRPGAGGYAGFLIAGMESEIEANSGSFGALTFSFATSLLSDHSRTIAELAQASFLLGSARVPGWTPVFEASDPNVAPFQRTERAVSNLQNMDPALVAALAGETGVSRGVGPSRRIEINQPVPTRGVLVAEHRTIHVEGRVVPGRGLDAVVVANRQASLTPDGGFAADLELEPGRQPLYAVALFVDHTSTSATFQIDVATGSVEPGPGRRYALVIGNADYSNGWNPLTTPVLDAEEVARVLHDRFEFQLELPARTPEGKPFPLVLKNATKDAIQRALFALDRLGPDDSLLVYYAGHGYRDAKINISYWIPIDAAREEPFQWLAAEEINGYLRRSNARHILVVSDSCFSGTMAMRDSTPAKPVDPKYREERQKYLAESLRRPSRNLLSSGGDEPVADLGGHGHSVFAYAFLRELEEFPEDRFTTNDIQVNLRQRVVGNAPGQVPQFLYLGQSGNEGGDLVFFRSKEGGPQ